MRLTILNSLKPTLTHTHPPLRVCAHPSRETATLSHFPTKAYVLRASTLNEFYLYPRDTRAHTCTLPVALPEIEKADKKKLSTRIHAGGGAHIIQQFSSIVCDCRFRGSSNIKTQLCVSPRRLYHALGITSLLAQISCHSKVAFHVFTLRRR